MPDLTALRYSIKTRKPAHDHCDLCIDLELRDRLTAARADLEAAQSDLDDARKAARTDARLSAPSTKPPADLVRRVKELTAQVDDLTAQVNLATARVEFEAVPYARYRQLYAAYPGIGDDDGTAFRGFCLDLCSAGFRGVTIGDTGKPWVEPDATPPTWDDIRETTANGELDEIMSKVFALNRQGLNTPFSPQRSGRTRP